MVTGLIFVFMISPLLIFKSAIMNGVPNGVEAMPTKLSRLAGDSKASALCENILLIQKNLILPTGLYFVGGLQSIRDAVRPTEVLYDSQELWSFHTGIGLGLGTVGI